MNRLEALAILKRYERGEATEEEKALVEEWFASLAAEEQEEWDASKEAAISQEMWNRIRSRTRRSFPLKIGLTAAAVVIALSVAAWLYWPASPVKCLAVKQDISPGGNHAVLTLNDGSRVILDSLAIGNTIEQSNGIVEKNKDGEISYRPHTNKNEDGEVYNVLSTPEGGQYSIRLADGSRVWLNAGSKLTFPARFSRTNRTVALEGEAYFEISANSQAPFLVKSNGHAVRVLGTSFNMRAYPGEQPMKTTLLTGKVAVENTAGVVKALIPNQQAVIAGTSVFDIREVDVEDVIAWKEGYFAFNHITLKEAFAEIARWYNVSFVYDKGFTAEQKISGTISKYQMASQVLHKIEMLGEMKFTIRDNHVYVSKK